MARTDRLLVPIASLLAILGSNGPAQEAIDSLEGGFRDPPFEARPRTWWHWTGGNITKEGITKDLEWMHRAGIAGFQIADVSFGRGHNVEPKIDFASAEWFEAIKHAAHEAERLGLEMAIFTSAGWSLTGGPWVQPEQAMKKLVWSETVVDGPRAFRDRLPEPPSRNGPMRDLGSVNNGDPTHYGDSAVLAFPLPEAELGATEVTPQVSTQNGPVDGSALLDDSLMTSLTVPAAAEGETTWLQYAYDEPFTARAITIAGRGGIPVGRVAVSDDGRTFRTIVALPGAQLYRQGQMRTFAFPETTAKFFRIEMTNAPLGPAQTMAQEYVGPADKYVLREVKLHRGARVHRWEEKAGFSFLFEYESVRTEPVANELAIPSTEVIDLTSRMRPDGTLDWQVPEGRWTILRLGYSLTGAKNRPATAAGLGYEVDKLSRKHVEAYYDGYAGPLARVLGPRFGSVLSHMLLDSWEAGMQNWTEDMLAEFEQRRGYDPRPFLPALTGFVVDSADVSDRFLWDFRRTMADMFADNFYAVFDKRLEQDGLKSYSEASGVSLEIPEDTLLVKSKVDIPMGEFWFRDLHPRLMYYQDVRGAASAVHVYGKRIVGAESFTGGGYESPFALKRVGDYWFAQGINRIIFHTSAHQPLDAKPGNTMVGTHLHRNITWAEQARPFVDYLSRNSYMLQRGLFVADLLYLLAEGAPSTVPIWGAGLVPPPPAGYDFDYINTHAMLTRAGVDDSGRIVLPDGMSYRVLVLPQVDRMRPEVARKLQELVRAGATIVGPRPRQSPSLMGFPATDDALRTIVLDLWGDLDGRSRTMRPAGRGRVVWGLPLDEVLTELEIPKDFEHDHELDAEVAWLHRRDGTTDIYYVANITDRPLEIDARFRVSGRAAEIWQPVTGEIKPTTYTHQGGRTLVSLDLNRHDAVFVVFRQPSEDSGTFVVGPTEHVLTTLTGPWNVRFPAGLGAPESIQMPTLESWTAQAAPGLKYYSGTAIYTKRLEIPRDWLRADRRIVLDLGAVGDLAEVTVNDRNLGIAWCAPFEIDVTETLRAGRNTLEIQVTNQWTNRLIGDATLPAGERVLEAGGARPGTIRGQGPELSPSGLLGPVRLVFRN